MSRIYVDRRKNKMSHTIAISFKYKTEGLSRWTYLSVFQANSSYGMVLRHILRHTKVLKEVNSSLLNPVQPKAEKCPQGDHEARSISTLLKEYSQGKPSMRSCLPLLKLLRYSTLRNLNVQEEPLTGEWCQLKLYLDKAPVNKTLPSRCHLKPLCERVASPRVRPFTLAYVQVRENLM